MRKEKTKFEKFLEILSGAVYIICAFLVITSLFLIWPKDIKNHKQTKKTYVLDESPKTVEIKQFSF